MTPEQQAVLDQAWRQTVDMAELSVKESQRLGLLTLPEADVSAARAVAEKVLTDLSRFTILQVLSGFQRGENP